MGSTILGLAMYSSYLALLSQKPLRWSALIPLEARYRPAIGRSNLVWNSLMIYLSIGVVHQPLDGLDIIISLYAGPLAHGIETEESLLSLPAQRARGAMGRIRVPLSKKGKVPRRKKTQQTSAPAEDTAPAGKSKRSKHQKVAWAPKCDWLIKVQLRVEMI